MKLGDNVDGFRLAEVAERKVVFAKGAMRVEVPVDYFRKVPVVAAPPVPQAGRPRVAGPVGTGVAPREPGVIPRVVPNLPRRPRLPDPPEQ
jgi:hypothetical protein